MSDEFREDIRRAFERRIGQPPAGATQRVLSAVEREHSRRQNWRPGGAAAAVMIAVAVVGALFTTRLAHQVPPANPAGLGRVQPDTPGPRIGTAAAYDARHGRLVVFGGETGRPHGLLADTWTWDGFRWTLARPASAPPPRQGARAGAYDPALGVVIFGGNDTWAWNGSSWRQLAASGGPGSESVALAFDPASASLIAYGYLPPSGGETWRLENGGWEKVSTPAGPSLGQAFLGWDGHRLILVGMPIEMEQGQYRTQTWAWDGSSWTRLHPSLDLPPGQAVGGYDSASRKLVVLTDGETWAWDGAGWSRLHPAHQPPPGYGSSAAADGRGRVLVFGGQSLAVPSDELWAWEASDWRLLSGSPRVPPASGLSTIASAEPAAVPDIVARGTAGIAPRLVPAYVPADMTASVRLIDDGANFSVVYSDDTHRRSITIGAIMANPPPVGPNGGQWRITFRGQSASYWIYDATAPLSLRNLTWTEPGTWENRGSKQSGVQYFASSSGITEGEFFEVLNSLRKV